MKSPSKTLAKRVFDLAPKVRAQVENSDEFRHWLETHPRVNIDDVSFFVVGGDMLRDREEMMLDWARKRGAIPPDLLAQAAQSDE